jgi:3-phenylpropionate/cinnamic acid dioxygenase small subunit
MAIDVDGGAALAGLLLTHEVEQFFYKEAALLDERRFNEWLELFAEDAHYWMPIRSTRPIADAEREFTQPHENSFFDDDKHGLEMRVAKLYTGYSWSEDPPSRTRHVISNVVLRPGSDGSQVHSDCAFILYRTRLEQDEDLWVGRREDRLRKIAGRWQIADRKIFLDQVVLRSKNLSNFF